jgi:hypothetical protein
MKTCGEKREKRIKTKVLMRADGGKKSAMGGEGERKRSSPATATSEWL